MSLEGARRATRFRSFFIKDILAFDEEDNDAETALHEDFSSSESSHSSAFTEREQDSPKPFPFSDSYLGFGPIARGSRCCVAERNENLQQVERLEKRYELQNSTKIRFEHYLPSGKLLEVNLANAF